MDIRPITEMPNLSARLGKATIAKIRYLDLPERTKGNKERVTQNTIIGLFQGYKFVNLPTAYHDAILGVCRAVSDGRKPLSPDYLTAILQTLSELSTQEIQYFLDCSESNARKYLQASKLAIQFITRMN